MVGIPPKEMCDDVLAITLCGHDSIETNAYINAKIELKKLELNKKKSHKIHYGKKNENCPELKAHEEEMSEALTESYLGDVISKGGTNEKNIQSRVGKGMGLVGTLINILKYYGVADIWPRFTIINSKKKILFLKI